MFIPVLRSIGLTDSEARVYLALLECGDMSVALLSRRIGLNQEESYDILGSLREKGVIKSASRGPVKYFSASDPRKLLAGFRAKVKALEGVIPTLVSLQIDKSGSIAQMYEGEKGMQDFLGDVLKEHESILFIGSIESLQKYSGDNFFTQWNNERVRSKIFLRILTESTSFQSPLAEIKQFSSGKFIFPAAFFVYGFYLATIRFAEGGSVAIFYGEDTSKSFKSLVEAAWSAY